APSRDPEVQSLTLRISDSRRTDVDADAFVAECRQPLRVQTRSTPEIQDTDVAGDLAVQPAHLRVDGRSATAGEIVPFVEMLAEHPFTEVLIAPGQSRTSPQRRSIEQVRDAHRDRSVVDSAGEF